MSTLPSDLRNKLERACIAARNLAERAATDALKSLAVAHHEPYGHMTVEQRTLRNKLRARARQLGDTQDGKGQLSIHHLAQECAYEQWHRMLFARFLAENNLLIEPEMGVAVSLDEVKELAKDAKTNLWALAGRYAQTMLPEIFRADDPVLQVPLAREDQIKLEALLDALATDTFTASDSLGWCYQFWQSQRKEDVNKAGNKIGADELPSVTQLFTEDYMVDFLLDNTLGAWHASKVLAANPKLAENAKSEEELRKAVALPGCPWKYLRFIKGKDGKWTPAAGRFDGWPKTAKELKCLDPCCGSGHFIVAMFERMVALRMAEEKLDETAAVQAAIRDNLFGLELDPRCTQIAAFNLALAAWRRVGHCALPAMHLACSGLAPNAREADWLAIVDAASSRIRSEKQKRQDAAATFAPINYFRPDEPVANLTGNLPHWRQAGTTYFVTFRCADALPQEKLHQWQQELAQWQAAHPEPLDDATRQEFYERFPQRIQTWLDSGHGECVLREPAMREIVESALRHFDGKRYRLQEFVVAPNHVHALVTPLGEHLLSDILHSWKSFTAQKINEARQKSGAFWQKESFDHIVRSPASLANFREYILSHPKVAVASSRSGVEEEQLEAAATMKLKAGKVAAASSRSGVEEERLEAAATMKLKAGMARLYRLFKNAPVLGSLINPHAYGDLLEAGFQDLRPLLEKALVAEKTSGYLREGAENPTDLEMAVTAQGIAKAAEILAGQFTLVATNVPYLGRAKQDDVLMNYCERVHPEAKRDLATCFVERCVDFSARGCTTAVVTPQNWLFLGTYKSLRERLLLEVRWEFVAKLGPGAFETITGEVVNVCLLGFSTAKPSESHKIFGLDVSGQILASDKANDLTAGAIICGKQTDQILNPDARIALGDIARIALLNSVANAWQGIASSDSPRFGRCFWELSGLLEGWKFQQSTVENTIFHGGREHILLWEDGHGKMTEVCQEGATFRGMSAWNKPGIAVAQMGSLPVTLASGELFDNNTSIITPFALIDIPAVWTFCCSEEFRSTVRRLDQKMNVTNSTFGKVSFDLAHWQKVAAEKYPHGLPKPFSSDPTQWLFNGHPKQVAEPSRLCVPEQKRQDASTTLQVAVARLVGYQWPRQTGSSFPDCPALGPDGLEKFADDDGIVCLPSVRGELPAAERLRQLLQAAYRVAEASSLSLDTNQKNLEGSATFNELELIRDSGSAAADLEEWLRNDFFEQHCDVFQQRPFVWHIWDGRKRDGFHALVNYHKLCGGGGGGSGFQPLNSEAGSLSHGGRRTLENLTHSYLGDWITRQKDGLKRGEEGADERLAAALALKETLEAIINGEAPYDVFVRWKPLAQQAIGWNPDINDGVRMNIRPFMASDIAGGKKGAGVLRIKPNIKWDKDRGKEPKRDKAEFPWFYEGSTFTGDRVNDVHLTKELKGKGASRTGK